MESGIDLFAHEPAARPGEAELVVEALLPSAHAVNPLLYGKFCEHLGTNIYHGMEAQILFNCTFGKWRFGAGRMHPDGGVQEESDREEIRRRMAHGAEKRGSPDVAPLAEAYFDGCAYGWMRAGATEDVLFSPDVGPHGGRAQRVEVLNASRGICQLTYLPLHHTRGFQFRLVGRATKPVSLEVSLTPVGSDTTAARAEIKLDTDWKAVTGRIELPEGLPADCLYRFAVTAPAPANFVLDRVLLYPEDHIGGADPDVIRLLKESRLPLLRWPGGNFVSGYRWTGGVGPVDARPTVPNPAWEGLEFNLFGTDEFLAFCREVDCEPLICVNAGDGTPEEAARWVEYCNGSPETPMGRLRAENGHPEPYGVIYWEIGNEIYGRWQVGRTTPGGYVDRFRRFREAMLSADARSGPRRCPDDAASIEILGCGCGNDPASEWNRRLIEESGATLKCITDHVLTGGAVDAETDPRELYHAFMGYATELERRYRALRLGCLAAGIRDPRLAITELQLFAHFQSGAHFQGGAHSQGETKRGGKLSPETMPRQDTISEALYHATIVNACIRLGDFVALVTHSATVNHGGGLRKERERVYANPVHHGCTMGSGLVGGEPVPVRLVCGTFSTQHAFASIPPLENVPALDAVAVLSRAPLAYSAEAASAAKAGRPSGASADAALRGLGEGGRAGSELVLMLVHRSAACGPVKLAVTLEGFGARGEAQVTTLAGETWYDRNTREDPDRIVPRTTSAPVTVQPEGGAEGSSRLELELAPFSLTRVTLRRMS